MSIDDEWRDDDMISRREALAARYLFGCGIELGALHKPLAVGPGVTVRYVDYKSRAENRGRYPELASESIVETDVRDDGFVLRMFEPRSVDFVVANHALEHSPDPYGTLLRWREKTRIGGILYFAVPIADRCYDRGRPLTTVEHLLQDHRDFMAGAIERIVETTRAHIFEFLRISDANIRRKNGLPSVEEVELLKFGQRLSDDLDARLRGSPRDSDALVSAIVETVNKIYDVHYHTFRRLRSRDFWTSSARHKHLHWKLWKKVEAAKPSSWRACASFRVTGGTHALARRSSGRVPRTVAP